VLNVLGGIMGRKKQFDDAVVVSVKLERAMVTSLPSPKLDFIREAISEKIACCLKRENGVWYKKTPEGWEAKK
jgi:hypothetical protein